MLRAACLHFARGEKLIQFRLYITFVRAASIGFRVKYCAKCIYTTNVYTAIYTHLQISDYPKVPQYDSLGGPGFKSESALRRLQTGDGSRRQRLQYMEQTLAPRVKFNLPIHAYQSSHVETTSDSPLVNDFRISTMRRETQAITGRTMEPF